MALSVVEFQAKGRILNTFQAFVAGKHKPFIAKLQQIVIRGGQIRSHLTLGNNFKVNFEEKFGENFWENFKKNFGNN